jgi:hypothetical protein
LVRDPDRIGFKELKRNLLGKHDITDGNKAFGQEAQHTDTSSFAIELLDVQLKPVPDSIPLSCVAAATTEQSAPLRRIGTFGLTVVAACAFCLGIAGKVLTFRTRA